MPQPLYIICSESGTEDAYTGLVSHFNVIDRIVARPPTEASEEVQQLGIPIRIVSVWRAQESDFEGEFEHEMRLILLPKNETSVLLSGPFLFLRDKPRHRTTIIIGGFRAGTSGQLVAESRIKRPDATEWMSQRYVVDILVELSPGGAPPGNVAPGEGSKE